MRLPIAMKCLFGLSALGAYFPHASAIENISPLSPQIESAWEVQEYVRNVKEDAIKTIDEILAVPNHQQSFENTLRPWNRLTAQISRGINRLKERAESVSTHSIISQSLSDLYLFSLELSKNTDLVKTLVNCCHKVAMSSQVDQFQHYLARRMLQKDLSGPLNIEMPFKKPDQTISEIKILTMQFPCRFEDGVQTLSEEILAQQADMVYIQDIFADEDAYRLYQNLQKDYPNFIYMSPSAEDLLNSPNRKPQIGWLVASKFPVKPQKTR